MAGKSNFVLRVLATGILLTALAACELPRSGPNKSEIFAGSVKNQGNAFIVPVDDFVTRATAVMHELGFSSNFRNAGVVGSDVIRPGDVLGLTIWENVDDGLLTNDTGSATLLQDVQVDGSGFIFVPYAGRVRAAGNSTETVRRLVTRKLEEQTPDPQVEIRREAGDGSTVSIIGTVNGQGVYPIERPTRTLSAMLAKAGGVTVEPKIARITVTRGGHTGQIRFADLFSRPQMDIALRGGDKILVEADQRAFVAMGATGQQVRIPFESDRMSAIDAIAHVGGLRSETADPTGVFVFRNEAQDIAHDVLGRTDLTGTQRLVYVIDLTKPNGLFLAGDFEIRDDDLLYVTEAPFAQWSKVISAVSTTVGAVGTVSTAVDTVNTLTGG